jgi:hypothetical protein
MNFSPAELKIKQPPKSLMADIHANTFKSKKILSKIEIYFYYERTFITFVENLAS